MVRLRTWCCSDGTIKNSLTPVLKAQPDREEPGFLTPFLPFVKIQTPKCRWYINRTQKQKKYVLSLACLKCAHWKQAWLVFLAVFYYTLLIRKEESIFMLTILLLSKIKGQGQLQTITTRFDLVSYSTTPAADHYITLLTYLMLYFSATENGLALCSISSLCLDFQTKVRSVFCCTWNGEH